MCLCKKAESITQRISKLSIYLILKYYYRIVFTVLKTEYIYNYTTKTISKTISIVLPILLPIQILEIQSDNSNNTNKYTKKTMDSLISLKST